MVDYNNHQGLSPPGIDSMMGINNLTIQEKRTKDGQVPKRRGPKPDAKPALTRRQQLNRQAQRTHRERKEAYVRNLEEEVLKLRGSLVDTVNQKNRIIEMNRSLRDILHNSNIPIPPHLIASFQQFPDHELSSDSASVSAKSHPHTYGSAATGHTTTGSPLQYDGHHGHQHMAPAFSPYAGPSGLNAPPKQMLDREQAGIDFVLTLERPCMGHLPFLLERASDSPVPMPCGHGLMMSCPPHPYTQMPENAPWGTDGVPNPAPRTQLEGDVPMHTWQTSKSGLAKLLELSEQFDLDGEITPVQAWRLLSMDPRFNMLSNQDIAKLADELGSKVHCFGFGAVVEDFEVRDALENVLSRQNEMDFVCS